MDTKGPNSAGVTWLAFKPPTPHEQNGAGATKHSSIECDSTPSGPRIVHAEQQKDTLPYRTPRREAPRPLPVLAGLGHSQRIISVNQAAKLLSVSTRQVRRYLESGELTGHRFGERGWWKVEHPSLKIKSDESDKPDIVERDYVR
jgi:excisionase family DNA binding protein